MLKDDIMSVKEEIKEISFAREILNDYKKDNRALEKSNKRWFIAWIITFVCFLCMTGWIIYLYNDIGTEVITEETTKYSQEIDDTGDINNSNIVNGGDVNGEN